MFLPELAPTLHRPEREPIELDGLVLAGVVEATFLVALADEPAHEEHMPRLAALIHEFTAGFAREFEVIRMLRACGEALDRDGYDTRIDVMLLNLPTLAHRRYALRCTVSVLLRDARLRVEREGEFYVSLAQSLGLSFDEAIDLLEEGKKTWG